MTPHVARTSLVVVVYLMLQIGALYAVGSVWGIWQAPYL